MTRRWHTHITERGLAGKFLATIGLVVVLGEIALHFLAWFTGTMYELNEGVLLVGALIGFVGFYILDPKRATDGANVITSIVPRFGRRKSDAVAVPEVRTEVVAKPVDGAQG